MNETRTIPLPNVAAYGLWGWTITSAVTAIVLRLTGYRDAAFIFHTTMCVSLGMAVATTAHCYTLRVMRLMRALDRESAMLPVGSPDLHSIN